MSKRVTKSAKAARGAASPARATMRRTNEPRPTATATPDAPVTVLTDDAVIASNFSLHQLFDSQMREMLDSTDLNEEQKQGLLIAMSCPCCGAGGFSYTAPLKRRT